MAPGGAPSSGPLATTLLRAGCSPRGGHCLEILNVRLLDGNENPDSATVRFLLFGGSHCGVHFSDVWQFELELVRARNPADLKKTVQKRVKVGANQQVYFICCSLIA